MSLYWAWEAISSLGECSPPTRGGRAVGGGLSGQLERQQAREGHFPALSSLSSFEVSRETGGGVQGTQAGTDDSGAAFLVLGPSWALEHSQGTQGPAIGRELRLGAKGPCPMAHRGQQPGLGFEPELA